MRLKFQYRLLRRVDPHNDCLSLELSVASVISKLRARTTSAMDTLLDQIKAQAAMTDETGRRSIQNKLRDLQHSIEAPEDTMRRILFLVRRSFDSRYSQLISMT